jgi:RND family efflux transporter MFP subunit
MLESKAMIEQTTTAAVTQAPKPSRLLRASKLLIAVLVVALIAGVVVTRGISSRIKAASLLRQSTLDLSVPVVSVVHPRPGALKDEVVLPGNIQAFTDAPIYARASGYVKRWYADLGAHVQAGQVLAEIEAPEMDQQVLQAQANLQQARAALDQALANYERGKADLELARVTAQRWKDLAAQGVVSRQDNDQSQAQLQSQSANLQALEKAIAASRSNVTSLEANLAQLQEWQAYKTVKAPFDGVITARNTDVGALINAGNGGQANELFHLASVAKLRVFVNVPQIYSRAAIPGIIAELTLTEFPGQRFPGKLVRTAEAIDSSTRTLLAELAVDNAAGHLRPGAYAEVHLKLPAAAPALVLPVSALLFRTEGLQVGVVRDGGKVELTQVTLGKDYGAEVEVVSGIGATDPVIANPPDSLTSGTLVRVVEAAGK